MFGHVLLTEIKFIKGILRLPFFSSILFETTIGDKRFDSSLADIFINLNHD